MSSVTTHFTAVATEDLQRLSWLLNQTDSSKVTEGIGLILEHINLLNSMPLLGMTISYEAFPELRKLNIAYEEAGYVVLYRYCAEDSVLIIETIYHTKE